MASNAAHAPFTRSAAAPVELPLRLKLLLVTTPEGAAGWLTDAFEADGAAHVLLEEALGVTAGLTRLRDEVFDAVLVTHEPGALDALELAEAARGGGSDEPLIILGRQAPQEFDALAYEAGADDYCCLADTTVRGLLWKFARAMQRFNLTRENRRLVQGERQRLQHEHQEAERLLDQQRALIEDLHELSDPSGSLPLAGNDSEGGEPELDDANSNRRSRAPQVLAQLPAPLIDHYRELLRTYVIMGTGNLSHEMSTLAELLAEMDVTAQQTMQLHVAVLEELIQGLGNRSARHVMNRADLLALEVMGHLADRYRQRTVGGSLHVGESLRDSLADFGKVGLHSAA